MTPQPTPPVQALPRYLVLIPAQDAFDFEIPEGYSEVYFPNGVPSLIQTDAQFSVAGNSVTFNGASGGNLVALTITDRVIMREPRISETERANWSPFGTFEVIEWRVTLPVANATVSLWQVSGSGSATLRWESARAIDRESCYLLKGDGEVYLEGDFGSANFPCDSALQIENQESRELVLWFTKLEIEKDGVTAKAQPFNGALGGVVETLPT